MGSAIYPNPTQIIKAQQIFSAGLLLFVLCITLRMLLAACIDSVSLVSIGRRELAVLRV